MTGLPRCLFPGCPIRYHPESGPDRLCLDHQAEHGDTVTGRLAEFAELSARPGEPTTLDPPIESL